jgi:AbrB family looped-hinge helix DNA binding protein
MRDSTLTIKGQVTIPAEVRRRLGLRPGDHVGFAIEGDEVRLVRKEANIEAAFGICKTDASVSLEEMDQIIKHRAQP